MNKDELIAKCKEYKIELDGTEELATLKLYVDSFEDEKKLQKSQTPKFSVSRVFVSGITVVDDKGHYTDWTSFYEGMCVLEIQGRKFGYLTAYWSGGVLPIEEPFEIVVGLPVTEPVDNV